MEPRDDARGFFRSAESDYDRTHYAPGRRSFMTVRLDRMLQMVDSLELEAGARVLDAGCGPGHLCAALAEREFRVYGIDTSPGMVGLARERVAGRGRRLSAALASIEHCPFADQTFDLVCSAGVIEYLPREESALREFQRVLRPGGRLLLTITNRWSPMLAFDFAVEFIKRRPAALRGINRVWTRSGRAPIRARSFPVRRQRPAAIRSQLESLGFELCDAAFFHFVPVPHPLPQLVPTLSDAIGDRMERWARGPLGPLADGYAVVARKRLGSGCR